MEDQYNWETVLAYLVCIDNQLARYTYYSCLYRASSSLDDLAYQRAIRNSLVEAYNAIVGLDEFLLEISSK